MCVTLLILLRMALKRQTGGLGMTDLLVIKLIADASQKAMVGEADPRWKLLWRNMPRFILAYKRRKVQAVSPTSCYIPGHNVSPWPTPCGMAG